MNVAVTFVAGSECSAVTPVTIHIRNNRIDDASSAVVGFKVLTRHPKMYAIFPPHGAVGAGNSAKINVFTRSPAELERHFGSKGHFQQLDSDVLNVELRVLDAKSDDGILSTDTFSQSSAHFSAAWQQAGVLIREAHNVPVKLKWVTGNEYEEHVRRLVTEKSAHLETGVSVHRRRLAELQADLQHAEQNNKNFTAELMSLEKGLHDWGPVTIPGFLALLAIWLTFLLGLGLLPR